MVSNLKFPIGVACALVWIGGGCTSPMPSTQLQESIARAARTTDAIELRVEGDPLDVASAPPGVLTLQEAVRLSVMNGSDVQAALARVRVAEADARQSRLLPNPILSVVFRWPEGGGSPTIEAGLAADLVSLLTQPGRISAADDRLRAASAGAMSEVLDVLTEVQMRYVAIQANGELVSVLEDRIRISDRLLETIRARLNVGEGTRLELLSIEAQRVELQAEISDRRLEGLEERLGLARLMGRPSGTTDWQVTSWSGDRGPIDSETAWVKVALENRPEVMQRRFELAALGADYKQTGWAAFEGAEIGIDAERDGGVWSAGPGVSIPIPLFDFGQGRREKARAVLIEARHELTRVQRRVVEEVRRAYAVVAASRENLQRVKGELIPLAEQRLAQADAQFRGGQTDFTMMLLAEEQLRAARIRLVEMERRTSEGMIQLQRAVGGAGVAEVITSQSTTAPATQSGQTR